MLMLLSPQVIEKQHRMMEQLGSQIKVLSPHTYAFYTLETSPVISLTQLNTPRCLRAKLLC